MSRFEPGPGGHSVKRYRKLKVGEIIQETDEYISVFSNGGYIPVKECSVGQELLECNTKYYRRPINDVIVQRRK